MSIINQLDAADMPATAYRVARRLLDRAVYGRYTLPTPELCHLCGVDTIQSARRLLAILRNAGVLRFSCGPDITDIAFAAFDDVIQNGAQNSTNGAQEADAARRIGAYDNQNGAQPRPEGTRPRAEMDRERAESARESAKNESLRAESARSHNGNGWLDGIQSGTDNQPTNGAEPPKQPETPPANSPPLEAKAVALLIEPAVGVALPKAKALAERFPFAEIRRQVFGWLPEFHRGGVKVPALIHRIENGWACPEPDADIDRALWDRYRTPAELEADAQAEAELAAMLDRPLPKPRPKPPQPTLPAYDDPWAVVVAETASQIPDGVLERARAEPIGDLGEAQIWEVTLDMRDAAEFSWMQDRGAVLIRKTLTTILGGRAVLVDIVIPEAVPS